METFEEESNRDLTNNTEKEDNLNKEKQSKVKIAKFKERVLKDVITSTKNFFANPLPNQKSNNINKNTVNDMTQILSLLNDDRVKTVIDNSSKDSLEKAKFLSLKSKFETEYKPYLQISTTLENNAINSKSDKSQENKNKSINLGNKSLSFLEYRRQLNPQHSSNLESCSILKEIYSSSNIKNNNTNSRSSLIDRVSTELVEYNNSSIISSLPDKYRLDEESKNSNLMLSIYKNYNSSVANNKDTKSGVSHKPWRLYRVISAHTGWVRCIDVDPTNEWFVSGSVDKIIKFWDLASGKLKLSLTGHINTVRDLKISKRSPYLFSAGEDGQIKCWDLERNQLFLNYHGHLSGVYSIGLHLNQDILVSGGRDSCVRLWDIRTKKQITALEGHNSAVASVLCNVLEPQIISSSLDSTVRFYDIRTLTTSNVLTYHKKGVRSIALHEYEQMLYTGGCDKVKQISLPGGEFMNNMGNDDRGLLDSRILNSLAVNKDDVIVGGYDDGRLKFWDCKTGDNFQTIHVTPQPGSLDSESGIFAAKFDMSSSRLITGECDKTIKMWKEVNDDELELNEIDDHGMIIL